jgi:hypothetical protein
MSVKSKAKWGLIIALAIAAIGGWGYAEVMRRNAIHAEAALQTEKLASAGFIAATKRKDARVGSNMRDLQRMLDDAQEAGAPPLVAAEIRTETVRVEVPVVREVPVIERVEVPVAGRCPIVDDSAAGESVALDVSGRLSALVTANRQGEVFINGRFFTLLREGSGLWEREVELPIDEENTQVEAGETMQAALRSYLNRPRRVKFLPRNWRHWRAGWNVGVGACLRQNTVTTNTLSTDFVPQIESYVTSVDSSTSRDWGVTGCAYLGWGAQL